MAIAAGKRLGSYRILERIGVGGMGEIYRARDSKLRRDVAVKVLPERVAKDPEYLARFEREALAVAALSHPNILSIFDFGTQGGMSYAVTELLEGETLRSKLTAAPIPQGRALSYALQIARGISAAHKRGVVHRDLKPDNVFIVADGHVKILDFGLAKRTGPAPDGESSAAAWGSELTEPGTVMGTAGYMSPEQVRGYVVDHRSDIFAFGTIFYELLSGRKAFKKETPADTMAAILNEVPAPLSASGRNIPQTLDRIVQRCLEKAPQQRFQSVDEVVAALEEASFPSAESAPRFPAPETGVPAASGSAFRQTPTPSSRVGSVGGERRQVTILVCGCELFDSEAYLELDAEDQARVLRDFEQACDRTASRFDGTVVQCDEHGLLLCFGYPVAFEDGARRAAHTALAILGEMTSVAEQLRSGDGLDLNPWVGLHTGPAIATGAPGGISLVGEARNVAVRLKDLAVAGQIICSGATHRLIRNRFECSPLGEHPIRGRTQPVEIFRVQGLREARNPIEAAADAGLSPLTGRDVEIGLLKDRWERAQGGAGQVVLLRGDPGLGKSRLVYTMKQAIRDGAAVPSSEPTLSLEPRARTDAPVVEWRCSPRLQNTGLYPATDFFERFLGLGLEDTPAARFERLVRHLREYDLARNEVVPLFASLLSLPADDRFPPLGLSPVRQREETFRALVDWLNALSDRRPVLFVVEDLHWADASTLDFLGQFLGEVPHHRILAMLTCRPEFQPPWPAPSHQTGLALTSLTQSQVADLMNRKTGGAVAAAVVEQVYARTGGVPLFVEEYTRMMQESGMFDTAGGTGTPVPASLPREIPSSLQDLLMARLDRMDGDREIAQLAATLGREFSYELLGAVATADEASLEQELGKLVQAEILYPKGRFPRCRYVFKHALLEDALYNSLVRAKRQEFHRRIAEVLEAGLERTIDPPPELIAHHFTEAGMAEKAIRYWLKAGLRSREKSAEVEAISHLERGRNLLSELPESAERDAGESELLGPLGTAYIAARGYAAPEVGPVFRRARELCERAGSRSELFALMLGIWEWHTVRGDLRLCVDLAEEGMEFARRLEDPGMRMEALFMAAETMLYRADFAGAREGFATAVTQYDDRERTRYWAARTSHNAGVTCRSNLAVALWHLGFPDLSRKVNLEMRLLAREIGHPYSLAYALHHTCWLHQFYRFGSEVLAAAEEQIDIASEQGFALWHATGTFFKGVGILLEDGPAEALALLQEGHGAFRAGGARLTLPFQLSCLGEAFTRAGRFEDAQKALDEGLTVGEDTDERCQEPELHRLRGELLLARGADDGRAAEGCFRRAIETAQRQNSRAWELRAATSLARLWRSQERRAEARTTLEGVYGSYTEGFTTPDLMDASALLETLG